MAHLLLMYQYMRAKREYNTLTAQSFKNQQKRTRIKKNIEKTQKYYTDAIARIKSQASNATKMASVFFNEQAGLGGMNMGNYYGLTANVCNFVASGLMSGKFEYKNGNGETIPLSAMSQSDVEKMLNEYQTNGCLLPKIDENGNKVANEYANGWSAEQANAFSQLMRQGQMQQQQVQMWAQNMSAQYQQNASIWEEAMIAQLEAQQDLALEPLNYEETMMELEETTIKASLEEKKEEMQNLKQELSERIKEDVPKFGLS